jgi:hypothetical protein
MEVKKTAPFGFVTGCHPGDKFMVQATLASIRHFCPEAPICLVADGAVEVSDLERQYGLFVLRTNELADSRMKALCCGSYYAKLSAMWEGPFEHFVWLDSDSIVWGNFTSQINFSLDFQIFWSEISIPADAAEVPGWLGHFYFDLENLLQCDPCFEWRGRPYFSTGAFAARRNAISFEKWLEVKNWERKFSNKLFQFGEQGQLEYMVHSGAQKGEMKVDWSDLQYLVRHHGQEEIDRDTAGCGWRFPKNIKRPRAVHFCGQKPHMHNWRAYSRAFTIARLEHYRKTRGELGAWLAVINEERKVMQSRLKRKVAKCQFGLKYKFY